MRRISGKAKRAISLVLVMILLISVQNVYAVDEYTEDLGRRDTNTVTANPSGGEEMESLGDEEGQSPDAGQDATVSENSSREEGSETAEEESKENRGGEKDGKSTDSQKKNSDEAAQDEKSADKVGASDGSLSGETLHFVDLYWEDRNLGEVEALFDGGTDKKTTQRMFPGERGEYETTIPKGDYSRVTFLKGDTGETLGDSWDFYGQESLAENRKAVDFDPLLMDTYYYDSGANPSWWGNDPGYEDNGETEASVKAQSITVPDGSNGVSLKGHQIYFVDLQGMAGEEKPSHEITRAYACFKMQGDSGIVETEYTMYSISNGVYTLTFPEDIDEQVDGVWKYQAITFRTEYQNDQGEIIDNGRIKCGSDDQWYTTLDRYEAGTLDAFCFNTNALDSYWGAHPRKQEEALNGQYLYFDARDNANQNGVKAQIGSFYLDWDESPGDIKDTEGELNTDYEYVKGKGYKIKKETLEEGVYYFRFPRVDGGTEHTMFRLTFDIIDTGVPGTAKGEIDEETGLERGQVVDSMVFRFIYVSSTAQNMLQMDAIKEMAALERRIWGNFEFPKSEETRSVCYDNALSNFEVVQVRFKTDKDSVDTVSEEQLELAGWTKAAEDGKDGQGAKYYSVTEDGWITLKASAEEALKVNLTLKNKLGVEDIPREYGYVQFRGLGDGMPGKEYREGAAEGKKDTDFYYSEWEEIDNNVNYPCFKGYSDPVYGRKGDPDTWPEAVKNSTKIPQSESAASKLNYQNNQKAGKDTKLTQLRYITGEWGSVLSVNNDGDSSREIPTGEFTYDDSKYYVTTTFYDYYSNWEMAGYQRRDNTYTYSQYHTDQGTLFNYAISEYFKWQSGSDSNIAPLYFGDLGGLSGIEDGKRQYRQDLYLWNFTKESNCYLGTLPKTGLVDASLSEDENMTVKGVDVPYFDEDFLRGYNALGTAVGSLYKNVAFPFWKNKDGYWEFDSSNEAYTLRLCQDSDEGYFLENVGSSAWVAGNNNKESNYFPYTEGSSTGLPLNSENMSDRGRWHSDVTNHMFGNRFDIDFSLPEGEQITMENGQKKDITFEFSGDDDCWVYVDGELLLDIGGIHDACSGNINFKTGKATITPKSGNAIVKEFKLDQKESHTLTMFYFERGLTDSNLKVTFNFPKENSFSVSKEVDTSAADQKVFGAALSNMGGFNYLIQNMAVEGSPLKVENSAGYNTTGKSQVLYREGETSTSRVKAGDIAQVESSNENGVKVVQETGITGNPPSEKDLVTFEFQQSMDLSDMAYLRMKISNGTSNNRARELYVELVDARGKRAYGRASDLGYLDSISFLPGYASVMRIDLTDDLSKFEKQAGFDLGAVKGVRLGLRNATAGIDGEGGYYLVTELTFYGAWRSILHTGFAVDNSQISDYGSLAGKNQPKGLSPATGAWYTKYTYKEDDEGEEILEESIAGVVVDGLFSLQDNQTAKFNDKFRIGSYISLAEQVDSDVFDTSWSILENGVDVTRNALLQTRIDAATVVNPDPEEIPSLITSDTPLKDQKGESIKDGRTSVITEEIGKEKTLSVGYKEMVEKGIVFRSYLNPDNESSVPVNLNVVYKNTLKVGSLTIEKRMDETMQGADGTYKKGVYTFDVYYTNVAGRSLETYLSPKGKDANGENQYYIKQTVTVTTDENGQGSVTLNGIPAGTSYYIQERSTGGAQLVGLQILDTGSHKNVEIAGVKDTASEVEKYRDAYVTGTIVADGDGARFQFTNKQKPFYMNIKKVWATGEPSNIGEVHIQLQRRLLSADENLDSSWQNVTRDFFGKSITAEGQEYVVLEKKNQWQLQSDKALDLYANQGGQETYVYRIQELDVGTGKLSNYTVEYAEELDGTYSPEGSGDVDRYLKITYKAVNSTQGLEIVKKWIDGNNEEKVRPDKIRVFLQRSEDYKDKGDEATWLYYHPTDGEFTDVQPGEEGYIELTANGNWKANIDSLPIKNQEETYYYYRVIGEQMWTGSQWKEITRDDGNAYESQNIPVTLQDRDNLQLAITNTLDTGNIKIIKNDSKNSERLKGAAFKLERLVEESSSDPEQWNVDDSWPEVTGKTDEDGECVFKNLPYGVYKITETQSPSGYVLLKKPIYVVLTKSELAKTDDKGASKTITVTVKNEKQLLIPKAGAGGSLGFTIAGLALILGGGMLLYIRRMHRIRQLGYATLRRTSMKGETK